MFKLHVRSPTSIGFCPLRLLLTPQSIGRHIQSSSSGTERPGRARPDPCFFPRSPEKLVYSWTVNEVPSADAREFAQPAHAKEGRRGRAVLLITSRPSIPERKRTNLTDQLDPCSRRLSPRRSSTDNHGFLQFARESCQGETIESPNRRYEISTSYPPSSQVVISVIKVAQTNILSSLLQRRQISRAVVQVLTKKMCRYACRGNNRSYQLET